MGYGRKEAEFVCISTAWSQIQLENTVKCKEVLYDIEGDTFNEFGFKTRWCEVKVDDSGNPRKAVFRVEDLGDRLASTVDLYKYEYQG